MPTRDRAERLGLALRSLARQTLPLSNFEVVVVDNGSVDKTKAVVAEFENVFLSIRYIYEPSPGLHVGRHQGCRQAKGDILVFIDDDVEAFPTLLSSIAAGFEDSAVALVGGKCLPKYDGPVPDWISAMWARNSQGEQILGYLSLIDLGERPRLIDPLHVFGCNFSIRRSILLEAGGFHPDGMPQTLMHFRGDGESYVSRYIAAKGYKAFYHPEASVYHHVPGSRMTIEYFYQRAYNEGISSSFGRIRAEHGLDSDVNTSIASAQTSRSVWSRISRKNTREIIIALRNSASRLIRVRSASFGDRLTASHAEYLQQITAAYEAGYAFHQKSVQESKILLSWVLRPNYWDAQVPDRAPLAPT